MKLKDGDQLAFPYRSSLQGGMTMRDYFAAAALTGLYAHPLCKEGTNREFAQWAYGAADAMLAERAK